MSMNTIIQQKRKELGLTQEQVADYLGVSTPAVSKWEKGITSPDIALLPPLARLLKTDLKLMLQVSIYLKQDKAELAALELEKALCRETARVQLLLTKLVDAELAAGEMKIAETIAKKSKAMVDLLDMWEYNR